MKVLHVDTAREWRGGQEQLRILAPRVGVGVVAARGSELAARLRAQGEVVHEVDFRGSWLGARELGRVIRRVAPDVVAAHTSHAHAHALAATALPVVVHRRVDFKPKPWSRRKYRRAAGFIAVSGAVADVLQTSGVASDRVVVVPDAVDMPPNGGCADLPASAPPRPDGQRLLLSVGALVPHKGHRYAVEALADLPDCALWILGEGALRGALSRLARRRGVAERLWMPGHDPSVRHWMHHADLLVHPSTEEGRGQVVIEALLAGLPVVASEVGGIPETLGDLGEKVRPADARALARGIQTALEHLPRHKMEAREATNSLRSWCAPDVVAKATQEAYVSFAQSHVTASNRHPSPARP